MQEQKIHSALDGKLEITVFPGHFATRSSHINYYIDVTRMKHEYALARQAAIDLSQAYTYEKNVDTIVCLDGSEIIGAFLARHLATSSRFVLNSNKNISVITPEFDSNGQMLFRDNLIPMLADRDVLLLISTVNSGRSARRVNQCVKYYGGRIQGIAAIFTSLPQVEGIPVYSLFTPKDIPGYAAHTPEECPMCRAGKRIDALANSYGFSMLH